jgi:hypothetical protein
LRIVVRAYDTWSDAQAVITLLEGVGVSSDDISVVAPEHVKHGVSEVGSEATAGGEVGAVIGGGVGLLAGLGMLAIPGIGPVVAAGWLATTAIGAVAGAAACGWMGSLISAGVPESEAHVYMETIRRGGTLVTAKVEDGLANRATEVMDRYDPINASARADAYREQGWKEFDPNAQPYTLTQPEIERMRS